MPNYDANLQPISVPNLSSSSADALATFQASFASSIVNTTNSLLASYLDLKESDFYAVGDFPELWQQWYASDSVTWNRYYERPDATRPTISYTDLANAINALDALTPPAQPTLVPVDSSTPNLDATAPTVVLPDQPDTTLPTPPSGAPSIIEPALPTEPTVALPEVPTFEDLNLPPPPAIAVPSFDEVAPTFNLAPYTGDFSYVDPGYTSELRDELVVKLLNDLRNGSYGIEPGDEAGLWGRARDRAAGVAKAEIEELYRRAAATGFPMPPGALYEAIQQAEQKHTNALNEAERDIALRRSELYVEGRKFTFQQVQQYEKMEQDLYNATQERALNYAKAIVEYGIMIYRASLEQFKAQMDAYAVRAQVFEQRVRGELAKAEVYRTQLLAEQTRVEFNRAKIDAYLAQLKGLDTVVDLYKSQLMAAGLLMQVQSQKLDLFKAQLQNYSEQLRAKESEYNIYLAATRGELAKVDVYKAQIDAYNATLSGRETQARVQLQANESTLQNYRAAVTAYQNELEAAVKVVQARVDDGKLRAAIYGTDVDAYRALTTSTDSAQQKLLQWGQLQQEWLKAKTEQETNNVKFRLQQLTETIGLQEKVGRYGVDFMKGAMAASIGGLNSLGVKEE